MHRALDGQAAAAGIAVGERAVARGEIICLSACCTYRGSIDGPGRQRHPLAFACLRLKTDHVPFLLRKHVHFYVDDRPADAGIACLAAAAASAYRLITNVAVVIVPTRRIGVGLAVVEVSIIQDTFATCASPSSVRILAALAARSPDNVVTRTCPLKVA